VEDLFAIAQTAPRAVPTSPGLSADPGAGSLDKDDFLKILLTQLTHQDPTQPMEDREFVAQMAQFSTLEQMTNLNTEMARVAGVVGRGQALQLLGKVVEVEQDGQVTTGTVDEINGVDFPQLLVSGRYYALDSVRSIFPAPESHTNQRGTQP
jgi:flagellar basal-body rod modification protein FlgD